MVSRKAKNRYVWYGTSRLSAALQRQHSLGPPDASGKPYILHPSPCTLHPTPSLAPSLSVFFFLSLGAPRMSCTPLGREREFFVDNLLVQIHSIIVRIRWTGLAPWEFEFPLHGLINQGLWC